MYTETNICHGTLRTEEDMYIHAPLAYIHRVEAKKEKMMLLANGRSSGSSQSTTCPLQGAFGKGQCVLKPATTHPLAAARNVIAPAPLARRK